MKAKKLKEILNNVDDDADVLLYDGLDEGDVFCTLVAQVDAEHYVGSCKGSSCTEDNCDATKFLVLAGFGTTYDTLDKHKDGDNLYLISDGPEAEPSKIAAQKAYEEERRRWAEKNAEHLRELAEGRKRRYCVNCSRPGSLTEDNFDTMDEVNAKIETIDKTVYDFCVLDRVEQKIIMRHEVKRG